MLTAMTRFDEPSPSDIESEIDALLKRWARWLRAGKSGMSTVGHSGSISDEEYRDAVAEMLDQLIAQLPRPQKRAIMDIWYRRKSETQAAAERNMPRGRFKTILSTAVGWLCGSLSSRIDAPVSVDNVDRWASCLNR